MNLLKTEGATELLLSIVVFIGAVILSLVLAFGEIKPITSKNKIQINGEDYILRSYIRGGVMYVDTLKQ